MSGLLTCLAALLIFVIYYILHSRRSQNATPLPIHRSFDPFSAFDAQLKNHLDLKSLTRLHAHYGTTFQITPMVTKPIIYTICPENLKEIMTNGRDFGVEPLRGESMRPFCGKGFLTSDGDDWMASRRMLKPCFGKKHIEDLSTLNRGVDGMIDKIVEAKGTVDLQPLLFDMFLDTSFQFLLGIDDKEDEAGNQAPPCSRDQFLKDFETGLLGTGLRIILGQFQFVLPKGAYLKTCQRVHNWLEFYISKQTQSETGPDQKVSMAKNISGKTRDLGYMRGQVLQSMLASKETTAVLISNTIFLLARHPDTYRELRAQILTRRDEDQFFTFDSLSSFTYLQNILKESIRIHPVFPVNGRIALRDTTLPTSPTPFNRRVARAQPAPVPAGTTIAMSFYTLNRDPLVFGADTESFRPDRWDIIHPTQYEFMPFGGGQRACLGREKSLAEAALVVARLAERFETLESRDTKEFKPQVGISCCNGNGCKVAMFE